MTTARAEGRGEYTYVGRKRGCGCAVAMAVDDREDPERVAKYVAEFLASGLFLERVTTEAVRSGQVQLRRCPHRSNSSSSNGAVKRPVESVPDYVQGTFERSEKGQGSKPERMT